MTISRAISPLKVKPGDRTINHLVLPDSPSPVFYDEPRQMNSPEGATGLLESPRSDAVLRKLITRSLFIIGQSTLPPLRLPFL